MPRLFIKIFFWFWLAMTLIGAILVVIALTTNPRQNYMKRQNNKLLAYGQKLIADYEEKGQAGLTEAVDRFQEKENIRLVLVDVKTRLLSEQPEQPYLRDFTRNALIGSAARAFLGEPIRPGGRRFNTFTVPLDKDYVLLAEVPKPSRLQIILDPHALTLRLAVTFLIAGVICYLLARSISTPILKLREATQKFAGGNLAIRVAPSLTAKKGELVDLAHDFDTMAERIENLLQSQQRLLRDISHELRSPLARLNVALELARQRIGGDSAPLARIEKESERLNTLIGQLLTITQLESQTVIKDEEPIDLAELLGRIVADANYECQGADLKTKLSSGAVGTMYGSEELLYRAIENVIRNATHYTSKGSVVAITLDSRENGSWAEISVLDHGPGVPEEALGELFRPFYRVGESRDRHSGGIGVGLAIAEQAIKLHGGNISAENHPTGGLLVTIRLPLARKSAIAGLAAMTTCAAFS
jgi:two-component system sensor histidine kinase CpxA